MGNIRSTFTKYRDLRDLQIKLRDVRTRRLEAEKTNEVLRLKLDKDSSKLDETRMNAIKSSISTVESLQSQVARDSERTNQT